MPFGFLRRSRDREQGSEAGGGALRPLRGVPFDALTEEWRLVGTMDVEGRLTDALNRREPISIHDVRWAPADGSGELEAAPGLKSVDPYDLIVVIAGEASLPPLSEAERTAHKIHKISYDVALEVPPYRIVGTVYLYPGSEPERLLDRATEMFVPVTDAVVLLGEREVTEPGAEVVLVNRFYLRGVEQVDRRTGQRAVPLPGAPLGGTSWRDRSR